jgi:hypothetical protein
MRELVSDNGHQETGCQQEAVSAGTFLKKESGVTH